MGTHDDQCIHSLTTDGQDLFVGGANSNAASYLRGSSFIKLLGKLLQAALGFSPFL
jgi:hypothetical protein